jgi:hypothetical protein
MWHTGNLEEAGSPDDIALPAIMALSTQEAPAGNQQGRGCEKKERARHPIIQDLTFLAGETAK